ncbi:hypothetical protein NPIL_538601, partial [Nephila pilipes]
MVKMILIRHYAPYPVRHNSKPRSLKVLEKFWRVPSQESTEKCCSGGCVAVSGKSDVQNNPT